MALNEVSVELASEIVKTTTFDIFNERDQAARRLLMQKHWATDITCYTPFGNFLGYDEIDKLWGDLHAAEKADWVFKPQGDMWLNSNLVMKGWTYGSTGEEPAMKGWDVIILSGGKVKQLYAMIEGIHTHPQAI